MGYQPEPIEFSKKAMWIGFVSYLFIILVIAIPFLF